MALEVSQVVDLAAAVDVVREGTVAEIRSTGVVDYEIARHRRGKVVVVGARHRRPQKIAELTLKPERGKIICEHGTRRQLGCLANAVGDRWRQALQ